MLRPLRIPYFFVHDSAALCPNIGWAVFVARVGLRFPFPPFVILCSPVFRYISFSLLCALDRELMGIMSTILTACLCTEFVNCWMLSVRSTFKFSVRSNSRPMNHIEQCGADANLSVTSLPATTPPPTPLPAADFVRSKHFGFTCAKLMCWFRSKFVINKRTFDSTKPHHSKWSSADCELTRSTIKCLYLDDGNEWKWTGKRELISSWGGRVWMVAYL